MKRSISMVLAFVFLVALGVMAQMPAPGAEHKKLDYFIGTWTSEGELKAGPMGGGGKFSSTDKAEWMDGGYFIVLHADATMPFGSLKGLAVFGYDLAEKKYTYNEFNSMGEANKATGTINGDEWVWTNELKMGDNAMKGRYTMKILSPTSYTFKYEVSPDGTNWSTIMDGKATKK
jgi:hypothetical protein